MKLSDRAILASLQISQWTGTATEKGAAREIERINGAQYNVVRARKVLMPDFPELEAVQKHNTAFRNWFNGVTLEYQDSNRLMVVIDAQDNLRKIGEWIDAGEKLADDVGHAYPDHLDAAETKLGSLFERKLYPDMAEIRKKFGYRFSTSAVPEADQLRNFPGFDQSEVDKIVANAEQAMKEQVNAAVRDIWQRAFDATSAMAEKLTVPIEQKGSIFRDSLISNMQELAQLMPKLNLFNDPEIDRVAKEMAKLSAIKPEALRTEAGVRAERAAAARKLAEVAKSFI